MKKKIRKESPGGLPLIVVIVAVVSVVGVVVVVDERRQLSYRGSDVAAWCPFVLAVVFSSVCIM